MRLVDRERSGSKCHTADAKAEISVGVGVT